MGVGPCLRQGVAKRVRIELCKRRCHRRLQLLERLPWLGLGANPNPKS